MILRNGGQNVHHSLSNACMYACILCVYGGIANDLVCQNLFSCRARQTSTSFESSRSFPEHLPTVTVVTEHASATVFFERPHRPFSEQW